MKVSELIEKLKEFDQDARVVLEHRWGDYNDLFCHQIKKVTINVTRDCSDAGGKYCNSRFDDDDIMECAYVLND